MHYFVSRAFLIVTENLYFVCLFVFLIISEWLQGGGGGREFEAVLKSPLLLVFVKHLCVNRFFIFFGIIRTLTQRRFMESYMHV